MQIDHIGLVVKSIEDGIGNWQNFFGYRQLTNVVINSRHKVKVVFLHKKDSLIVKLLEPLDESSPVFALAKRGGGLHHICFKCDDLTSELEHLKSQGLRVLFPPHPGEAFDNENIALLYAKQGLHIELIDTEKKAELISN